MPIRFPTDAANDPGMHDGSADGKGRALNSPAHHSRTGADSRSDEAQPGKGINQAGFVRERDGEDPGKD
ncbi:hypothetical protein [Ramlibacter sp. PS4R-6]|uniref:hypothetical protein n=1 Tax=Ramlibacter sp. PS4R-6 TaxID=3133438 RepID=UPI0030B0B292